MKVSNRRIIAGLIDHTLLRPDATYTDIKRLCEEALQFGFYSVCINPCFIKMAKELLKDKNIKVTTVIGFPLGMTLTEVKVYEAMNASLLGADELDIVVNIGALKSDDWDTVRKDLSDVIMATKGIIHKTIIETCYLDDNEKKKAVEIALDAGSEFIKTSTGFGTQGAKMSDIRLIKGIVRDAAGIKAAGGIRTLKHVIDMLKAGATRIGTSAGVKIMREFKEK
ncbi:MAG: deoxyribose-phosphate aldolase [Nitrospirota bacterium]|nr:deoxyribose-phosphate aldolase [Nitrospirota bacterium]MDH5767514.1 deoxyribose-phosphate aldolase [Nitrospirota bacterium]